MHTATENSSGCQVSSLNMDSQATAVHKNIKYKSSTLEGTARRHYKLKYAKEQEVTYASDCCDHLGLLHPLHDSYVQGTSDQ